MIRGVGHHRTDDAHIVHGLRDVREEFAHVNSRLSIFVEFPERAQQVPLVAKVPGRWFAIVACQSRLGIVGIDL